MIKYVRLLGFLLSISGLLSACATPTNHYDPLERVNRLTYTFNDKLDRYAVKPITKAYTKHIPGPAQQGVSNFMGNIADVSSALGNVLEAKPSNAFKDLGRIVINTLFGMFGLVDWASDLGLEKQKRGIGKALGRWGIGTGPYLVLPFFGSTTVRDSTDLIFNWTEGVPAHFNTPAANTSYITLGGIDKRAELLPYDEAIQQQLVFDRYSYIRDSYLQRQYNEVYRGDAPKPLELGEPTPDDQ